MCYTVTPLIAILHINIRILSIDLLIHKMHLNGTILIPGHAALPLTQNFICSQILLYYLFVQINVTGKAI